MDLPSVLFFSIEAMKRTSILVLPSKQRLHKLFFLQNFAFRNPAGTRRDTSSLVNRQVDLLEEYYVAFNHIWKQVHHLQQHDPEGSPELGGKEKSRVTCNNSSNSIRIAGVQELQGACVDNKGKILRKFHEHGQKKVCIPSYE